MFSNELRFCMKISEPPISRRVSRKTFFFNCSKINCSWCVNSKTQKTSCKIFIFHFIFTTIWCIRIFNARNCRGETKTFMLAKIQERPKVLRFMNFPALCELPEIFCDFLRFSVEETLFPNDNSGYFWSCGADENFLTSYEKTYDLRFIRLCATFREFFLSSRSPLLLFFLNVFSWLHTFFEPTNFLFLAFFSGILLYWMDHNVQHSCPLIYLKDCFLEP